MADSKSVYSSYTMVQESVVNIRNFRDLVQTAVQFSEWEDARYNAQTVEDAQQAADNDRTRIGLILPHEQMFFLEARRCSISSFNLNGDLFTVRTVGQNRWIGPDLKFHPPPQPQKVPRLVISPQLSNLWHGVLNPSLKASSPLKGLPYMNLIIVQGLSGSEIRKIIVIESVREAACLVFHELANGFSVVFIGLMLKSEYEDIFEPRRSCQLCFDVEELRNLQMRPRPVSDSDPKRLLGIIC